MGGATVMKGFNAEDRGKQIAKAWSTFKRPVAVGLDASRFDQHVSRGVLEVEHRAYTYMNRDPELARLLAHQLANKVTATAADGKVKYVTNGGRMSGDMNTALGNCLLSCLMVYSYMRHLGISKYRLFNDGDDCVLIVERRHLHRLDGLKDYFLEFGFNMKVEKPVYILEEIEFCQSHPVFDGVSHVMVRNPTLAMSKDSTTLVGIDSEASWNTQRGNVAACGLSLTQGIPVMQAFYEALGRGTSILRNRATPSSGMEYLAERMDRSDRQITAAGRCSYCLAFGIAPKDQVIQEAYFNSISHKWAVPTAVNSLFCPSY
jgi:hypothetical protein